MNFDYLNTMTLWQGLIGLSNFFWFWFCSFDIDALRNAMRENNLNPFNLNCEWGKSDLKRENRDLCRTKNVIKM